MAGKALHCWTTLPVVAQSFFHVAHPDMPGMSVHSVARSAMGAHTELVTGTFPACTQHHHGYGAR